MSLLERPDLQFLWNCGKQRFDIWSERKGLYSKDPTFRLGKCSTLKVDILFYVIDEDGVANGGYWFILV